MFFICIKDSKATVHRGSCEDCNDGDGKPWKVRRSERWFGPYATVDEVKAEPVPAVLKPCRKCRPYKDP
jgi:hypothetical protein